MIPLLGLEKSLKFTTLSENIFVPEQYLTSVSFILSAVSVPQMQLQVIRGHFPKRCCGKWCKIM